MSRSRDNADAVTTVPSGVGRNMIINGGMNVSQRATSVTGIGAADGYFTCDRWFLRSDATAGRLTMTQTADGPNGISANCIKLDCTTADTSIAAGERLVLEQPIEGQNLQRIGKGVAGAKETTLSFYVKASAAFTFVVSLFDGDNDRMISKLYDTTTDWVRHEIIIPADVDDGSSPYDDDNATSLFVQFFLHAGATFAGGTLQSGSFANNVDANRAAGCESFFSSTNNNFFITGVQLEVGPVATEFEQEDISVTLDKCKRYCQDLSPPTGTASPYIADGYSHNATVIITVIHFSEMRATPTLTLTGTPSDYTSFEANTSRAVTAVAANGMSSNGGGINFTVSSGLTAGRGNGVFLNADITHRSILDSEL